MKVGDLVRLDPTTNGVKWLDVLFIIIEECPPHTGMVVISSEDWTFPMPKRFLEAAHEQ